MSNDQIKKPCPICSREVDYYELECDNPFTAPPELAYKALGIWGCYDASKEIIWADQRTVHFKLGEEERLVKMLGFDRDGYNARIKSLNESRQICDEEGCPAVGYPCFTLFDPEQPMGYYCEDHMHKNGVCPGCHMFMAGFESFDFSSNQFCSDCNEFMRDEMGYDECGEEDEYPYEDIP
jgi:hypothetical protein